jgi:hypothetical protein
VDVIDRATAPHQAANECFASPGDDVITKPFPIVYDQTTTSPCETPTQVNARVRREENLHPVAPSKRQTTAP